MPIKRKNGAGLQIKKRYYRLKAKISLPVNLDASLLKIGENTSSR